METTKQSDRFYFDGQLHIPARRIEETVSIAIDRGLDALFFTDYGHTGNFDYISANSDAEGKHILTPNKWDIQPKSKTVLELSNENGSTYILKAEEVKTKEGHLLVWGIEEAIENGLGIRETLQRTYQQGGIGVFSHLLMGLFHGCGRDNFNEMYKAFRRYPLGLEQNGQIAWIWDKIFGSNEKVGRLAREHGLACFGTSDIHGAYRKEHKKVGKRYHSSVPRKYIDPEKIKESLAEIMISNPEDIRIEGGTNSLLETILWNLASVKQNGRKKISDLADGFLHRKD